MFTTDFHTHILPGIDDGSPTAVESVKMLKQELEQGIETVFLTPHFTAAKMYPQDFLDHRKESYDMLLQESSGQKIPGLILGAEVGFYVGMSKWEQLDQLQLGNTGYILIEMPLSRWQKTTYEELESIYFDRDLIPIIAHIERYLNPFYENKILNTLAGLPVLLQSNCSFVDSWRTQRRALRLLNDRRIHLLASDCHSATWRQPCLGKANKLISAHLDAQTLAFLAKSESMVLSGKRYFQI